MTVEVRCLPDNRSMLSFRNGKNYVLNIPFPTLIRIFIAWESGNATSLPKTWDEDTAELKAVIEHNHGLTTCPPHHQDCPRIDYDAEELSAALLDLTWLLVAGDSDLVAKIYPQLKENANLLGFSHVETKSGTYSEIIKLARENRAIVLYCCGAPDDFGLLEFEKLATNSRISWIPLTLERDNYWVGPYITPGIGAQFLDVHERRIAAGNNEVIIRALRQHPIIGIPVSCYREELFAGISSILAAVLNEHDSLFQCSFTDGEVTPHIVLPLPRNPDVIRHKHTINDLFSPECGIALTQREIMHHSSIPEVFHTIQVETTFQNRISVWDDVVATQGSTWGDKESARLAALGEAAERYSANMHDTLPLITGSYRQLTHQGKKVLAPDRSILYSEKQYANPEFPAVPFTVDTIVEWVEGYSETEKAKIWVPAAQVFTNWRKRKRIKEPVVNIFPFAGVAAGPNKDFACCGAIEELIERHATMLWWLNRGPAKVIQLPHELTDVWREKANQGQQAWALYLPCEFDFPVVAGILQNTQDQLLNAGFAARSEYQAAVLKAWTEAVTLQDGSRDLLNPASRHLAAIEAGVLPRGAMRPYSPNRDYLSTFRPDFSDCTDLLVQQQLYLDPKAQALVENLLKPNDTIFPEDLPELPCRSLACYQKEIENKGYEIISVDITPPDIKSVGVEVYRVIIPGLLGNAAAAYPPLGKGRAFNLPVELGWWDQPVSEDSFNRFPIPHA
ncbi:YcaO-like family protein [Mobiluncus mulieris]|uniref:YcaO-like family protein n=2 Tax=Mobiluncus mulieris TaxID=2052 RepID=UPI001B8AB77E|nr:YcaO-like family protein [Mobiluncus mulieris]